MAVERVQHVAVAPLSQIEVPADADEYQLRRRLTEAIHRLGDREKTILVLVCFERLPLSDITTV